MYTIEGQQHNIYIKVASSGNEQGAIMVAEQRARMEPGRRFRVKDAKGNVVHIAG